MNHARIKNHRYKELKNDLNLKLDFKLNFRDLSFSKFQTENRFWRNELDAI